MFEGWRHDFPAFFAHVGPRPSPEYSIDRWPNKDGNYEPGNVRWATREEQGSNKSNNRHILLNGAQVTMAKAVSILNVKIGQLDNWLGGFPSSKRMQSLMATVTVEECRGPYTKHPNPRREKLGRMAYENFLHRLPPRGTGWGWESLNKHQRESWMKAVEVTK